MSAVVQRGNPADPWKFWTEALAGGQPESTPGHPHQGYYRDRKRAVAIWYEDGDLHCAVSSGYRPSKPDEIDDLFGFVCRYPISFETYQTIVDGGTWPEDPTPEIEAARVEPGIGHNSAKPEDVIRDEIETTDRAFQTWLKSVGGVIATEEHDLKAKEFQARFQELFKRADEAFEAEKADVRKIGQAIDAKWRGPKADAKAHKDAVGAAALEYRKERKRREDEDARKAKEAIDLQRAEQAKRRTEAQASNQPAPVETPIIAAPVRKAPAGFREYDVARIIDLSALVAQIAEMKEPPSDFVQSAERIALSWLKAGVTVRGAVIEKRQKA